MSSDARRPPAPLLALPALAVGAASAQWALHRPALWIDEAASLGAVHQPLVALRQSGGTMSTYYALLTLWTTVGEDRIWVRALSLLLGLVAIVVLTALVRRWRGDLHALVVAALVGAGAMWGHLAAEARGYTLALLLAIASWAVLDRLVQEPRRRLAVAFALLWVALPPTHGLAVLLVPAQGLALAASRPSRSAWTHVLPGLALGVGLTAALTRAGGGGVTDWVPPTAWDDVERVWLFFVVPHPTLAVLATVAGGVGVAAGLARWRSAGSAGERFRAVAPACWAVVPLVGLLAVSAVHPVLVPRYLFVAVPAAKLLFVDGARALVDRLPRARIPVAVLALLVVAASLASSRTAHPGPRWDRVAASVAAQAEPGDAILFPERRNRAPFEVAWAEVDGGVEVAAVDFDRPLGDATYIEPAVAPAVALRRTAAHERVWVVYRPVFWGSPGAHTDAVEALDETPGMVVTRRIRDGEISAVLYERR